MTPTIYGNSNVADDRDPVVVIAADDRFGLPLAVTLRSALDSLAGDRKLLVYVLDGGIKDGTKTRVLESLPAGRYQIEWLTVDATTLAGLPVSGHINLVSYYRILLPRVLPTNIKRVIYLDADLIVCADLARLWDLDLGDHLCLAAQDCAAPYLDSSQAVASYEQCRRYLGSPWPVPNFRELGLSPQAAYFNAGVMLVDLAGWRREDLSARLLACLDEHREHVRWWDQYALNVVLAGRWGPLDLRWNQGSHAFIYPSWQECPLDRETYVQLRDDPYIVHFTTRFKPWRPLCPHPWSKQFFECVDRTQWAGWRPPRMQVIWAHLKTSERRLRHGRIWLQNQARQWLDGARERRSA